MGTTTQWERHAFVLTDIESSTQRWEADSTAMAADLAHHDETITAAFVGAGGEQLKSLGDGFLYRFRTVESAARAAVEAQIALHSAVWPHAALHVRMGVHVGEAQVRDGDYFGPTVNRCARVTAAGSGGQILATREVVEDIATEPGLADRLHHHGACRLKDLGEPVEIWEILHAEQVGPVSPRALIEGRHNLPYHLSSFVGRRDDISELRSLVRDRRLVTLTGSGGVGKTRLALQVMALLADDFPDGTWLVSLDSVERPEQVAERALEALDLRAVSGEHPLRTLAREVNARRMLILFDSCEHVIEPVARTIDAIANDRLRLLTTSRRPLGIEGEMVWRVRSLRTDSQRRAGAQTAHLSEAVQLFVERAKERNPELELAAPDEVEAASQLVRRLDGIPLAIELAAARLGALDVLGLERKLSQGFPLVDESYRRPPRHRTIEATIEWSDRLLSESSRWLLRRLTIFSSPPDLQTLEEVCGKDLGPMVVDQLDELIDASLVSAWVDAAGTRRFRMLDAVASFAADRWAAEDLRDTRGRHADWAAALAAADGPLVHAEASCLERLSAAEHDLERAVAWLFEHRPDDGVNMATNLAVFWVVSGQAALGRRWLDRALEDSPADASIARAKLLEGAGIAASLDADYPRSDDMLVQAADMFSEIGRDGRSAYPRFWRARSTIVRGYQGVATVSELEAAHERLGRSLALMREHGDALGLVLSLPYEGWVRMLLDASEDPLEPLREAMALVDSPGLERVSAYAKAHMAHIVLVHGDDPDASDVLLSDAIAELRLARDRQNLLICLLLRAAIELRRGHVQPASVSVREAAAIAARGGTREWEPAVLALGWAVSAEGDALLACTLAGHLDATLPSWQVLLANTGVGPLLERLQSGLETRDELVRRTAANAGRSQSAGHLVGLLARVRARRGMTDVQAEVDHANVGKPKVLVLGGGLAGLTAALQMTTMAGSGPESGKGVAVAEGNVLFGGKARSLGPRPGLHGHQVAVTDKGYHIFPHWYWDLWAVLASAGLVAEDEHSGCTADECTTAGGVSRFSCPKESASRDYTLIKVHPDGHVESVGAKISLRTAVSVAATLSVMLGLVGADRESLDRRTLEDHLQARWYAGNATLERVREVVLKALANPSYDASALTTSNTFRRWLPVYLKANWRALRGPLQTELIDPFVEVLCDRGVKLCTGKSVKRISVQGCAVTSVEFTDGECVDTREATVIAALPSAVLVQLVDWVDGPVPAAPPEPLGRGHVDPRDRVRNLNYMESAPMASLDLYLRDLPVVAGEPLPKAHFSLVGSAYAVTGFVASGVWRDEYCEEFPGEAKHLVQFVCSEVGGLAGMTDADVYRVLRHDIGRFIPELDLPAGLEPGTPTDPVVEAVLLRNDGPSEQVTRNEAGTWERRPSALVGLDNMWLAGDYCRCPVDVASMEAAVSTGLLAANAAVSDGGEPTAGDGPSYEGPDPVTGPPGSRSFRMMCAAISGIAIVCGAVSVVVGFLLSIVTLPYRVARRYAMHDLEADPLRRRRRDRVMTFAGVLALVVGPLAGVLTWAANPHFSPSRDPYSDLAAKGAPGAWILLSACFVLYVLLLVFTVPVRRFLPWSRLTGAGLQLAAVGYVMFPFVRLGGDGSVGAWHVVAAACILLGPNWSVVNAALALRHAEPTVDPQGPEAGRYPRWRLGPIAMVWAPVSVGMFVLMVVMSLLGLVTFWVQVLALTVGHFWILPLTAYLLASRGPARTSLLPGPTGRVR